MSKYQYYEFAALDGPISEEGMVYARNCSGRAEVSRVHWSNEYCYGDFRGSVDKMLEYYDSHFYIANWGSVIFALAFTEGCLDPDAIQHYLYGHERYDDTLSETIKEKRHIIWWTRHDEGDWGWTEGSGRLNTLVGIREELIRGDYRALFLGWLGDFSPEGWRDPGDNGVLMPLVPAGLDQLTYSQQELIEHFPVDPDALVAAAEISQDTMAERIPIDTVLANFSAEKMRGLLQRVAEGDGGKVMAELERLTYAELDKPKNSSMTCVDFATKTLAIREARLKREAKEAVAKKKQEKAARQRHLKAIMKRADTIWLQLESAMFEKSATAYDSVAKQLLELRDAYRQAGKGEKFATKLSAFSQRYSHRPAMKRRIKGL